VERKYELGIDRFGHDKATTSPIGRFLSFPCVPLYTYIHTITKSRSKAPKIEIPFTWRMFCVKTSLRSAEVAMSRIPSWCLLTRLKLMSADGLISHNIS